MYLSKWITRVLAVVACLAMLPLAATAMSQGVAAQPDKLEATLRDQLSVGGISNMLVRFAEQADLSAAYRLDWEARGEYVVHALRAVAQRSQAQAIAVVKARGLRYESYIAGNELYIWGADLDAALQVAALPEVTAILAPRTYYVDPIVSEPPMTEATTAWGLTDTKATTFWTTFGVKGDGIVVANIDTGVQYSHPALVNQFRCPGAPNDAKCWKDPANVCGSGGACDNNGHGTHTMGTMVAKDNPSLTYIAGMAPNATWIACKGCETNTCSDSSLNACADWILAPGGSAANRPHIVNNSWGGGGGDAWYRTKVQAWRAAGIFPAFSAGNSGPSCGTLGSPGDYQESFASAAHSSSRAIASFSSRGPSAYGHNPYTKPNISAPGVNVCSTVPTNGWSCGYSGTSMASPHSAGAVALLWSCNGALIGQVDQTFQLLQSNADSPPAGTCGSPGDGGNYTFGYGYLNVLAAGNAGCNTSPTLPQAPTNLVATAVSDTQIDLTWADNANNESGFRIERGPDGVSFAEIATVGANVTSYSNTGLTANTTYYYRVRAYNSAGNSSYSNVANATTLSGPATMHVDNVLLSFTTVRNKYKVTGTVTIKDANGNAVGSATVYARWTYPPNKTKNATATTNSSGVTTFSIQAGAGVYSLCVTSVVKAGYVFEPGANDCMSRTVP